MDDENNLRIEGAPGGRIVVAVDGSPASKKALARAGRLAAATDAVIDAVLVCEFPYSFGWTDYRVEPGGWDPHNDAEKVLTATVDAVFGTERPHDLRTYVLDGDAARKLIEHAADATMLIVGARGRSGLTGMLIGSVSSKCVTHAQCPVLVVQPGDFAGPSVL